MNQISDLSSSLKLNCGEDMDGLNAFHRRVDLSRSKNVTKTCAERRRGK